VNVRLRSLARRARVCIWLAVLLLLALPTLTWLSPELLSPVLESRRGLANAARDLSPFLRAVGWLVTLPPFLVAAWGLAQFLAFCRLAEEGRVFTAAVAQAIRRMGAALIAASVLLPLSRVALRATGVVEASGVLGGGPALLGGAAPLLPIAVGVALGCVFLALGAVMTEAVRLSEENERFV